MITFVIGNCQYEGCEKPAEVIACGKDTYDEDRPCHPKPDVYCMEHGNEVADEMHPEYTDTCPNCGCMFGVN